MSASRDKRDKIGIAEYLKGGGSSLDIDCGLCPMNNGDVFDCDNFENCALAAKAYLASLDKQPEQKKKAPAKYEFDRSVEYELNGEVYIPAVEQEQIDRLIEKRAADLVELNKKRNTLKAFKRKYKEA